MNTVANKNLKWGVFKQGEDSQFERYVIEDQADITAFTKAFPEIKSVGVLDSFNEVVAEGRVVIATDRHPLSGFPTWCTESQNDSHPSSIIRVKLG
ncbi:unnamed protein product [marine sediment metagenome]|uniref:Uncharacterized protein n=1 Tax=marine sediment metagenome TaxID=412755 RepID=X0UD39_9ZZZZ